MPGGRSPFTSSRTRRAEEKDHPHPTTLSISAAQHRSRPALGICRRRASTLHTPKLPVLSASLVTPPPRASEHPENLPDNYPRSSIPSRPSRSSSSRTAKGTRTQPPLCARPTPRTSTTRGTPNLGHPLSAPTGPHLRQHGNPPPAPLPGTTSAYQLPSPVCNLRGLLPQIQDGPMYSPSPASLPGSTSAFRSLAGGATAGREVQEAISGRGHPGLCEKCRPGASCF